MTSVSEARVLEAAQNLVSNHVGIAKLRAEIRAAKCEKRPPPNAETGLYDKESCVYRKVEIAEGYEEGTVEVLPWYQWPQRSAAELGAEFGYCSECVRQVDRFREWKRLKGKKGGLVSVLVRVVGIMEKKAQVKA